MRSLKNIAISIALAASPVLAAAGDYAAAPNYTTDDFQSVIIDVMATAVLFIKENITLIGIMLLFGFVVGAGLAIWMKAKHVIS